MLAADVLITPLKILATALGTGVLPADNPVTRLQTAARDVDDARSTSTAATTTVAATWRGQGSTAAQDAAAVVDRRAVTSATDSRAVAASVESASAKVKTAADEINSLIESFGRAAAALGSGLFTVAGLVTMLPVAADHIGRGIVIVTRTQESLRTDTAAVLATVRHEAPANVTGPSTPTSDANGSGVAVKLPDGSTVQAPNERAARAVRAALSQRGVPYVWGGTTPAGFDCSGFTQWAYRQAGVELPRLAQDQDTAGFQVPQAQLQPGDLAVWDGHVAMYVGNNQLVEAGDPVQVSPLRTTNLDQGFQGFYRPR